MASHIRLLPAATKNRCKRPPARQFLVAKSDSQGMVAPMPAKTGDTQEKPAEVPQRLRDRFRGVFKGFARFGGSAASATDYGRREAD